jgi:hypothetical protein
MWRQKEGAVAKWQRCGLQSRDSGVRVPPAPPYAEAGSRLQRWAQAAIVALATDPFTPADAVTDALERLWSGDEDATLTSDKLRPSTKM